MRLFHREAMIVAAACTDAEFIELWKTHGGAVEVAAALSLSVRNVHARRRHMERKYNLSLDASKRPALSHYYKHLSPTEHTHRRQLDVQDGTVLIFSDAHFWPGVRSTAFKALLMFIREL